MRNIRSKLTYANVMVTVLAVIVLGGGTAYAAAQLGKESVDTKQLAKGAVTPAKLSKAAKKNMTGPTGPAGAPGAKGATGAPGVPGIQGPKGDAGAPATALFGVIGPGAEVEPGSSPSVIDAKPKGTGNYVVSFDRDVEDCSYSVTSQNEFATSVAQPSTAGSSSVFVSFASPGGTFVSTAFSIAVFC